MKNPKATIHKSQDGQYYYTITAKNGQTMATSETMTQKHNVQSGIWGLIKTCVALWFKSKLGKQVIEDRTSEQA